MPLLRSYGAMSQGITVVGREYYKDMEAHPMSVLVAALKAGLPDTKFISGGVDPTMRDGELRIVVAHKI